MKNAVYPGSFDPITSGHLDIIRRAAKVFDEVTVLIMKNVNKHGTFDYDQREELVKLAVKDLDNVRVDVCTGLLTKYMQEEGIKTIVKGLRSVTDFEYEREMALVNERLDSEVDTVFLVSNPEFMMVSSTIVRELLSYHANITGLVPDSIRETLLKMTEE